MFTENKILINVNISKGKVEIVNIKNNVYNLTVKNALLLENYPDTWVIASIRLLMSLL